MNTIPKELKRKLKNEKGCVGINIDKNIYVHIEKDTLTDIEKNTIKTETESPNMEFYHIYDIIHNSNENIVSL